MNKLVLVDGYQPKATNDGKAGAKRKRDSWIGATTSVRSPSGPPAGVPLPKATSSVHLPKK